jgi:hypothetical protein
MHADRLHVVAARSNPKRFNNPDTIYKDWVEHMLDSGVNLTVVEEQYGERPFVASLPHVNHIGVRGHTMLWTKENLLNIGIARLPHDWNYVATIDSDTFFRRKDWAAETVHALQLYDVVQPWRDCYNLGPNGEHVQLHRSFASMWHERQPIMQGPGAKTEYPVAFAHPGYAWAYKRSTVDYMGGLLDTCVLGAADHHMALAFIGRVKDSIHQGTTEGYKRPLYQFQERVMHHIRGNMGYLPGTIEHQWHGKARDRKYIDRWDILVKHAFDPYTDLKRNSWGVLELVGNKPELRHDIDRYFESRNEDSNTQ